jgi:hypothetical protein
MNQVGKYKRHKHNDSQKVSNSCSISSQNWSGVAFCKSSRISWNCKDNMNLSWKLKRDWLKDKPLGRWDQLLSKWKLIASASKFKTRCRTNIRDTPDMSEEWWKYFRKQWLILRHFKGRSKWKLHSRNGKTKRALYLSFKRKHRKSLRTGTRISSLRI